MDSSWSVDAAASLATNFFCAAVCDVLVAVSPFWSWEA